jgi:hypothetical protein
MDPTKRVGLDELFESDEGLKREVRWREERSDELITSALGTKITHARTFVQDAPPP